MKSAVQSSRAAALLGLALAGGLLGANARALTINYTADRDPALRRCDDLQYRGERLDAQLCYRALLNESDDARILAEAAWALEDLKSANTHFQSAVKRFPEDPALRTRWGHLFHMTHQDNEAVRLFQEALQLDPDNHQAKLGLASVSAGRFEDRARAWVEEVLADDPEAIEAHLLLARMDLEDGAIDRAEEALDEALRIAKAKDLPPLEAYALKASVDLLRDVTNSPWTARALEYNPGYGEIYSIPAHFYVITRRYREAIELLRRAVEIQPDLWAAHAELGVNLLRENRVGEAQAHLATAYQGDPFSAQIVNTLRLIDSFEHFEVLRAQPPDDEPSSGAGILMRLHEDEADVLQPYVRDLVQESIETFSRRYEFNLSEPVIVELYPEHDDFAVRTSGLPGIGLLGVTFGYLVAMDSPSGRSADDDFHWGTTLWHEMAHVFTLEATNHLVPRWYSEGISVFEEWSTGPLPGRHIPLAVLEAIREDKLLPIAELDSGFIRPTYQSQVIVSYMQAGLICQYIESRWGQRGLVMLLEHFAQGRTTSDAITQAFQLSPKEFDAGFEAFVDGELGTVVAEFGAWRNHIQQAYQAAESGSWSEAIEAAEQAIAIHPEYVAQSNPYLVKVKAHESLGELEHATATLQTYHERGGYDPGALAQLGRWLNEAGRSEEAIEVFTDIVYVAPLDEELHAQLGDWLLHAEHPDRALKEYQALLAMGPHDEAAAHFRLAQAYHALDDGAKTREHLLYALEMAPHYRDAQQLLLEIAR